MINRVVNGIISVLARAVSVSYRELARSFAVLLVHEKHLCKH